MKIVLAAFVALALAVPANAQDVPDRLARLDILPGWTTDAGTRMVGFRVSLAPGWKTYWRAPGDGGIPPLFDWSGSRNVTGVQFHWPVPEVFDQSGLRSVGYSDEVVIPVEVIRDSADAVTHLSGAIDIGVCDDVCVPVRIPFDMTLPETGRRDPGIVAALVDRPLTAAEAGVGAVRCEFAPGPRGITMTATLEFPRLGPNEALVIEPGDPSIWVSEPETRRAGGALMAQARLVRDDGAALSLDRSSMRFTVLGDGRAIDIRGCSG